MLPNTSTPLVSAFAAIVAAAASTDRLDVESAVAGEEAAVGNLNMYYAVNGNAVLVFFPH